MKSLARYKLLAFFVVILTFAGCKQPETIVIDESPTEAARDNTSEDTSLASGDASFRKLVIGEYNSISSLDPLFADNAASMRAVQLIYEGLVRLDGNGSIVPGLAQNWNVGNDSLKYTFKLRPNIFYHDSEVFSTGTGRRMIAGDVKSVFERMARVGVPPRAAHLFMNIKGFEPYYQEQHYVFNPVNRQFEGVSGIQAPNDSTVVFELIEKDPDFLKKLATPLAVIYPHEAGGRTIETFKAVGTGPFTVSSQSIDSTLIFSKFRSYHSASEIKLDRIDIRIASEEKLFQEMSSGEIHLLPQLGPQLMQSVLNNEGTLQSPYAQRYNQKNAKGATEFVLNYNSDSNLPVSEAHALTGLITDTSSYFNGFPDNLVVPSNVNMVQAETTRLNGKIYSAYSGDPFVRTFLVNLSKKMEIYDATLEMAKTYAPSREIGLFFTKNFPLIPDMQWSQKKELFRFRVQQVALQRSEIQQLNFNQYPWWFNPRNVTLPALESLN